MDGFNLKKPLKRFRRTAAKTTAAKKPLAKRHITRVIGRLATGRPGKLRHKWLKYLPKTRRARIITVSVLLVFVFSTITLELGILMDSKPYVLNDQARDLLPQTSQKFADLLQYDAKSGEYKYNAGYSGAVNPAGAAANTGNARINASFNADGSQGFNVTDPVSGTSLTMKPKFKLDEGKQDVNQILYPLASKNGYLVYTAQAANVKEDIVLGSYGKDKATYEYQLNLENGLEPRLESDGSLGVYGSSLPINGNISTGSDKDAQLLEKARANANKDKLIFSIPAPVIKETGKNKSDVAARFELDGSKLSVKLENLKTASYPLTIDPSVYVQSAQQFMRGNNETNIDFDVGNELIKKGSTTGARFDSWTANSMTLPSARWNQGTAVAGGYIYVMGGNNGSSNLGDLLWAKFNPTTGAIETTNPGNGSCANWCTNSAYNLPGGETRSGHTLVAYNGFLYVFGGFDGGSRSNSVFIAKLGANGEPSLWHPTDGDSSNWVYWYQAGDLSSERTYTSAVAYNNRMYLLGGQTNAATGGVTTAEYADIIPNGNLSSWTSAGMNALPSARFGHGAEVYNDRIYLIGGNSNGTLQSSVYYAKLAADGTMGTSWIATNSLLTARMTWGGNFSAIWGGYLYVTGGCTAIDAQGECTSGGISGGQSIQLTSINADGSLDKWGTMIGVNSARIGMGFVAWRNRLYGIGGCSAQNTFTGACTNTLTTVNYGTINQDGDASTVSVSTSPSSGNCTGADPYDCDLPAAGDGSGEGGQLLSASVILNGYLYVIGGCAIANCNSGDRVSGNISYVAIGNDGTLRKPPSCPHTAYGAWCVDSTNRINGTTGVAAAGVAVFGGNIYVVGGLTGGGNSGNIYRNTTNSNGSLVGGWSSQSITGVGATNVSYTFAYARANPSSAGANPGNLYIFGGCTSSTSAGCTAYTEAVYKCNIQTSGAVAGCTTSGQLQIGVIPGSTNPGLGIHAGTVYANYIYLVGGVTPEVVDLKTTRYAKFDNNNNVVPASGSTWVESPNETSVGRRRGAAFGYNGYLYVVGGYDANVGGTLNDIQFAKINVSDGSIGSFSTSAVTINQRWGLGLAVSNSYAYVIGGCQTGASPNCTGFDATVQTFQLYNNNSGSPAGYSASSNLFATDRIGSSSAILNGYIYIAGGCISATDCTTTTDNVQYAPINPDGSVGTWANTTGTMYSPRAFGQLETVGGTLYWLGGHSTAGTSAAGVYFGTPAPNGDVADWPQVTGGHSLPEGRSELSATVWNNRIYATGGYLSSTDTRKNSIFMSKDLSAGGDITGADPWTELTGTPFNVARSGHVAIAYANNLYILGGYDGTNYLSDVQYAKINADGTLGGWSYTTSLPVPLRQSDGFAANGYMYLFGGRSSDNNCRRSTLVAPISANTTIASGNNPTGIGEWYETNAKYDSSRYGAAATYNDGKAYVLGGGCADGVVMQDDFDSDFDSSQWSYTNGMTANTTCQSTSNSNTFSLTTGGTSNYAATKNVNVANGGTVNFMLYIPSSNTGGCFAGESSFFGGSPDDVILQYSTNSGGSWSNISTYDYNGPYDPLSSFSVNIPFGARTTSTRFRWIMPQGEANDSFAIEDVSIVATNSTELSYTGSNRVVKTALLSQPQVARYSRLIDTDSDVFPTNWLLNGLDNSIGARWKLSYRSMTDTTTLCTSPAMTVLGQETNFGDVTLGEPELYMPLDGSGATTDCARFFYYTISIDSSQTYGYPDDVTRGPTIDNLTHFFTSDPGKRLRHGGTFIDGQKQPLDTPCRKYNDQAVLVYPGCILP